MYDNYGRRLRELATGAEGPEFKKAFVWDFSINSPCALRIKWVSGSCQSWER